MVEQWTNHDGTVEHLMVEQWNICRWNGQTEMVEQSTRDGGTVEWWTIRWWNSGTEMVEQWSI